MKIKTILILFTVVTLTVTGCVGTSRKLRKVEIGMTRAEVEKAIGRPHSVSAKQETNGIVEFLVYDWKRGNPALGGARARIQPFFVHLTNGKVDMFGEHGDFDTVKGVIERKEIEIRKR